MFVYSLQEGRMLHIPDVSVALERVVAHADFSPHTLSFKQTDALHHDEHERIYQEIGKFTFGRATYDVLFHRESNPKSRALDFPMLLEEGITSLDGYIRFNDVSVPLYSLPRKGDLHFEPRVEHIDLSRIIAQELKVIPAIACVVLSYQPTRTESEEYEFF